MNYYAQVIEVIFNKQYNAEAIVLSLAMNHPALFLELSGNKPNQEPKIVDPEYSVCLQVVRELKNEELKTDSLRSIIFPVKKHRELNNSTLRDALDYVNGVLSAGNEFGMFTWRTGAVYCNSAIYKKGYNTFKKYSALFTKMEI